MGRPCKLDEKLIADMCGKVRKGLTIESVCALFYIHPTSYFGWMEKGEEDIRNDEHDTIYAKLFYEIKKSYAQFEEDSNEIIGSGKLGWQGRAWWLERTNHKFMPKQQIEADKDGKVTVVIGGKNIKK